MSHSEQDQRIRVALVIPTMDRGGAEKQLSLLATHLPTDRFVVRVFLLTRGGPRLPKLHASGVDVVVIGKRFKLDVAAVVRLRRQLQQFAPDVVHTWIFAANSLGRLAALGLKRHNGRPVQIVGSERCVDPWKRSWHHVLDRWLAKRSVAITANSLGIVEFYGAHGIEPEKFRVIANAVEPEALSDVDRGVDRDAIAKSLKIDPDRKWMVAVGRLWPQKRYRDLIWAAELIGTLREDTTLIIVGDGPQQAELLRHRDAVTTVERVRLVGSRDDVADWLHHAEVFWNASEYEGQSNAIIEAMTAGLPVVASDIAGNRDLVIPGETGCLVKMGDTADYARQTNELFLDDPRRRRYGEAGRQRIARHFNLDAMIAAHVELYESLCTLDGGANGLADDGVGGGAGGGIHAIVDPNRPSSPN